MRKLLTLFLLTLPLAAQTKDAAPRALTSVTFANLGTPANGTIVYCSNCNAVNPATTGGGGAIVRRENGVWNGGGGSSGGTGCVPGGTAGDILVDDGAGACNSLATPGVTGPQGNGTKVQLSTGSTTTNDCVKFDANGNTVDAGAACGAGGGGASITQGTWASLPGTCTTNDVYFITNSPISTARCSAANTWSYFLSGIGNATPPVLGSFTRDNQASATTDTTHAGVIISNPTTETGIHVHALVKSAPGSTPYHVIGCFATDAQVTTNTLIGLAFRNSSSGKMTIFGIFQGTTARFVAFNITTSTGSVSTTPINLTTLAVFAPYTCLRIGDDGTTNRTFDVSGNGGITWFNAGSETRTSQYTADQVGFFVNDGITNTHFLHYAETN